MHERSIQLFQEALKDGDDTVHSIHVMVVGSIGTGKSTLIKRLIGGEVNMSERHTTEAIDVHCCDVSFSTGAWKWQTKEHDPDSPITREHMNHGRLCVAMVTVCGNAMREVLSTNVPTQYTDIYQAILAGETKLTAGNRRPLLNPDQVKLVYPDPRRNRTGKVEEFDLSLLYILIRNVSSVPPPGAGWANEPQDQPRDKSLGASIERIRNYRNHILGHSTDRSIDQPEFQKHWNKLEVVVDYIEQALGRTYYRAQLEKQQRQVISVYEAC